LTTDVNHPDRVPRTLKDVPSLPGWARIADALTVAFLGLAVWAALGGGFHATILGIRISANNVTRLLIEAVVVFGLRHVLVRTPPLHRRLVDGLLSGPARARRAAASLGPIMLALGLPGTVYLAVVFHEYDGGPYLRGDCPDYYRTARSLLEDGDLDISNQLRATSTPPLTGVSLAVDGRLVPKHPIAMPVASLPFVAVLGPPGALVFNLAQLATLLTVLYHLATRWASPWAAGAAVALTGVGTFLPHYVWNYSPDVFASLVLAAALLPLTSRGQGSIAGRFLLGGILTGLAVIAKQPLILFVPTTFAFAVRPFGRSIGALAAGLLISLGAFGAHNARLFGSPLVTAYDRIAVQEGSRIGTFSQRSSFTMPMREGATGQLMDPQHGLVMTSPVTALSLAGLPALAARSGAAAAHVGVGGVALFLMFSMYDQWNASHYGNRFLMPAVVLCAIPLATLFDWARDRFRRPGRDRQPDSKS
jgi:hypothetical protein